MQRKAKTDASPRRRFVAVRANGHQGLFSNASSLFLLVRPESMPATQEWAAAPGFVTPVKPLPLDTEGRTPHEARPRLRLGAERASSISKCRNLPPLALSIPRRTLHGNDGTEIVIRPGDKDAGPCGRGIRSFDLLVAREIFQGNPRPTSRFSRYSARPTPDSNPWKMPTRTDGRLLSVELRQKDDEYTPRFRSICARP